jgi:hypothetical protein
MATPREEAKVGSTTLASRQNQIRAQKLKSKLVLPERVKWLNTTSKSSKIHSLSPWDHLPKQKSLPFVRRPKISKSLLLVDKWTHQAQTRVETETPPWHENSPLRKCRNAKERRICRSFRSILVRV